MALKEGDDFCRTYRISKVAGKARRPLQVMLDFKDPSYSTNENSDAAQERQDLLHGYPAYTV
ncbi:MAG TPA: hypothetical protein VIY52_02730 [Streptosporangiaceae bacterium]